MSRFDIITIGGAVKDITFFTDAGKIFSTPQNLTAQRMLAFEYGAKINIKEAYYGLGGGAANTAVSLARLGFKVATIVRIGRDEAGKEVLAKFKKEKINTNFIQLDNKNPTGLSFVLNTDKKEREHIIFSARGANRFFEFNPRSVSRLSSQWFYLTSLSGQGWMKNLKEIFSFAAKKHIKLTWNPGSLQLHAGRKALSGFLKQTELLILNKDEAIELVLSGTRLGRKDPKYLNRLLYLLNILGEWGPKTILITNGQKGAWAYDGNKIYRRKIIKTKAVDTTGVGDSFGSSFLAGLIINKNDIDKALNWAMINSGSVVTKVGAQNGLLTRERLESKL